MDFLLRRRRGGGQPRVDTTRARARPFARRALDVWREAASDVEVAATTDSYLAALDREEMAAADYERACAMAG
jgi:hypothetical protein